jgi:hypothetical protein
MAQRKEWQEYHLTLRGWVKGSCRDDFGHGEDIEPPLDRVLTQRYVETVDFNQMGKGVKTPSYKYGNDAVVEALLAQFGSCPEAL